MNALSNLFWAIVFGVLFILCVIGIFWNWAHIFTAAICGLLCVAFIGDYAKERNS